MTLRYVLILAMAIYANSLFAQTQRDSLSEDGQLMNDLLQRFEEMLGRINEDSDFSFDNMPQIQEFDFDQDLSPMMERFSELFGEGSFKMMEPDSSMSFFRFYGPGDMTMDSMPNIFRDFMPDMDDLQERFPQWNFGWDSDEYGQKSTGMDRMIDAMTEEGLVDKDEKTKIRLTQDELFINGEPQSEATHKHYLKIFNNGEAWDPDRRIDISYTTAGTEHIGKRPTRKFRTKKI